MAKQSVLCCLLVFCVWTVGGCANVKPTRTSYLSDYSRLHKTPNNKLEVCRATNASLSDVNSFYIEEVAWRSPRPKSVAANPKRQTGILKSLRDALRDELAKVKPVVEQPGPHTAHVRAAVTDEVDSDPFLNIVLTVLVVPFINGGAAIEAEVSTVDGQQLAAVVSADTGGLADVPGFFIPQDHAKKACRTAARQLRLALCDPCSPDAQKLALEPREAPIN